MKSKENVKITDNTHAVIKLTKNNYQTQAKIVIQIMCNEHSQERVTSKGHKLKKIKGNMKLVYCRYSQIHNSCKTFFCHAIKYFFL